MAKASKALPIVQQESLSADEEKQMQEMRNTDVAPVVEEIKEEIKPQENRVEIKEEAKEKTETKSTTVPFAAVEEERIKRKATQKELEEQRLENARLAERVKLINEALAAQPAKQQPQKMEVPDPEKDALGALKAMTHNSKLSEDENKILRDYQQRMENERILHAQIMEVNRRGSEAANEFRKTNPDYDDAAKHLVESRKAELSHMGYSAQQIAAQIQQETVYITAQTLANNGNPAQAFYEIAKARGYAKKAPTAAQETEAQKIARIASAQRENASLSDLNGVSPNAGNFIDAKDVANMSEAQFAKLLNKIKGDSEAMHKILGA